MKPPIEQSVKFTCSPEVLFEMYMDSAKHSAATGAPARKSAVARAGASRRLTARSADGIC